MSATRSTSFLYAAGHPQSLCSLGYLAPTDKLNGLEQVIAEERDRKLEEARARRAAARRKANEVA